MAGHIDPSEAAQRIRDATGADDVLRAFMRAVSRDAPRGWDVGTNEILVVWPGWNESRDPLEYLRIVPTA